MDYDFLQVKCGEITRVVDIYHSLIGLAGCSWSEDYPDIETAEADVASGSLYCLKSGDEIIAVASFGEFDELSHLVWAAEKPCELARVGVAPEYHSRGIGTLLLKNVIEAAARSGYDGIIMLVGKANPAAQALYEKNGFARCGEAHEYGIDFYQYQMMFRNRA